MSDIKALEHATLKAPYEVLNKKFRITQKNIDREVAHVASSCSEIETELLKQSLNRDQLSSMLTDVVNKLQFLKRKAEESVQSEHAAARVTKRRLEHLKSISSPAQTDSQKEEWRQARLDRMMVDYFIHSGYYNSAAKVVQSSGLEDLTNLDIFLVAKDIETALKSKDSGPCLSWCYDNRSKLKKLKSSLEFNLRKQEFVELVKQDKKIEAIRYSRKHFPSCMADENSAELQEVMGLLAYSPHSLSSSPYKGLVDEVRWEDLALQFRQENYSVHSLSPTPVFTQTLQAGLSAIKTPKCYKSDRKSKDCPVCSPKLNEIGRSLPYSHCGQSRLICSISGEVMNEHNPPMMLPNGHVYSYNALKSLSAANDGEIVCPRTKEAFTLSQAEKVYIM